MRRLGLTATYEREDDGIGTVLDPYFGGMCYRVGFSRALADDAICHFSVAFAGVEFGAADRGEYEQLSLRLSKLKRQLVALGVPPEPPGEFMRAIGRLAKESVPEASRIAGFYLSHFDRRRSLLANSPGKLEALPHLAERLARSQTLVFAHRQETAHEVVDRLTACGIRTRSIDAETPERERRRTMDAFGRGLLNALVAPQLLNEGINLPEANVGIILASSRSRREMIQRWVACSGARPATKSPAS